MSGDAILLEDFAKRRCSSRIGNTLLSCRMLPVLVLVRVRSMQYGVLHNAMPLPLFRLGTRQIASQTLFTEQTPAGSKQCWRYAAVWSSCLQTLADALLFLDKMTRLSCMRGQAWASDNGGASMKRTRIARRNIVHWGSDANCFRMQETLSRTELSCSSRNICTMNTEYSTLDFKLSFVPYSSYALQFIMHLFTQYVRNARPILQRCIPNNEKRCRRQSISTI